MNTQARHTDSAAPAAARAPRVDASGPTRPGLRLALVAAAGALVANLAALVVGSAAGASLVTSAPEPINAITVIAATLVPLGLGVTVATWLIGRRPALRRPLAWAGLAFALATLPMAFLAAKELATGVTLGLMHVTTGLAWLAIVHPRSRSTLA
jgi:hypothetical protein